MDFFELNIQRLDTEIGNNSISILRDDLIPYSFGGNKVRKAIYFFDYILKNKYDTVITYGSSSSNHTRVIANMAKQNGLRCIIISPKDNKKNTFNLKMVKMFGTQIIYSSQDNVKNKIEKTIYEQKQKGYNPYFIEGGGHGNLGTKAYVDVFNLILGYEEKNDSVFDYIFLASGTGTTQSGLIIGNLINNSKKEIIGISIARKKSLGRKVVYESILDYIKGNELSIEITESDINFVDLYIAGGYGLYNQDIFDTIEMQFACNGLPLDPIYTGKAFWGMNEYIRMNNITNKNILFIHTGGTPLFFDYLLSEKEKL